MRPTPSTRMGSAHVGPIRVGGVLAVLALLALSACNDGLNSADATNSKAVAAGKKIYAIQCASCHGQNLQGQPNWRIRKADGTFPAPPHDDSGHTWHHSDKMLFNYIQKGGKALTPTDFKSGMPAFGQKLSDKQIWSVLSFIKSRWSSRVQKAQARMNK